MADAGRRTHTPREAWTWMAGVALALAASGLDPATDRLTWFLETVPVMLGLPLLATTWRRHPLTPLAYRLLAFHALVLIFGGHYSYAANPLFGWLQEVLNLTRNYYDRFAHLVQGFVPAMVLREVLLRTSPLRPGAWLFVLVGSTTLAFSALYELSEWAVAVTSGEAAVAFLATQGDPWDAQWDMFLALCGALLAQGLLARTHDRQLAALAGRAS